ncbi:unnamed protein product [Rangifer tarandus platyrhynchus]|uniref:Uncharacterized protein n=1 Tax=Rangifer tarandus platyrhynchus TaxID=3082113 RepID=A0AC60A8Y9_RANTA
MSLPSEAGMEGCESMVSGPPEMGLSIRQVRAQCRSESLVLSVLDLPCLVSQQQIWVNIRIMVLKRGIPYDDKVCLSETCGSS